MNSFYNRAATYYKESKGAKRKAAEYFLMHTEESSFMTQAEVAQKLGISQATITRCAQEIGYDGYHDMQKAMRANLRQVQRPAERLTRQHHGEEEGSSFNKSIEMDCDNIAKLLKINSSSTIEKAISMLETSPRVKLFASRTSYGTMSFLAYALSQIRPGVTIISEAEGRLPEQLMDVDECDLFFIANLPRYALTPVLCAKYVRVHGGKVISATDSPSSPLVPYSDMVLFIPFESSSFFNSNVATLALYNGIAAALSERFKDTLLKRLDLHNELLKELNLLAVEKRNYEKLWE